VVYVVAEQVRGDVYDLAVHPDSLSFCAVLCAYPASGVGACGAFCEVPFVFCESVVVVGVDDGVFFAGEGYSAEGVAVAEAAVEDSSGGTGVFEEGWDLYGQVYFNLPSPAFSVRT